MKVKVTDPCYVIDVDEWGDICDKAGMMTGEWSTNFDKLVTDYLRERTGVDWAVAGSTGYGDWANNMFGNGSVVVRREFCADSGMWCVIPAEFNERDNTVEGAILEFDDGPIEVEILDDNNGEWVEFQVTGVKDGYKTHVRSDPYRSDEE